MSGGSGSRTGRLGGPGASANPNLEYYESEAAVREYGELEELKHAEPAVLEELLRDGLAEMRMLDLGVGGGRTTPHFAPHLREYVGVDFSAALTEVCRRRFAGRGWEHVRFEEADARSMPQFADGSFDLVLFSWNGLDEVGDGAERERALREIHRVLAPEGRFVFSAHNLNWVASRFSIVGALRREGTVGRRLRAARTALLWHASVLTGVNPSRRALERRGFAWIGDERRGGGSRGVKRRGYARPQWQLEQLRRLGFRDAVALGEDGRPLSDAELRRDRSHWLYYRCRR